MRYLYDTNIFIYYLSESGFPGFEDFQDFGLKFDVLNIDLMINSQSV